MADFTASTALVEGLAVLAATNPPRNWSALPQPPERVRAAIVGGLTALAAVVILSTIADGVLTLLDISASTLRLGAGIVIAVVGVFHLLAGAPKPEPGLAGREAGFVPIAFPLLLNPALGFAVLAASADHGMATPVVAALVGVAMLVALGFVTGPARVLRGAGRLVGAVLVVIGMAIAVDGVFSL